MLRKFKFDYDYENDSLFMYDPKSKSKASIEMDDFIIDYNTKKEVSGIEILNATSFFKELGTKQLIIDKSMLNEIQDCRIDITQKSNFLLIKFLLAFKSNMQLVTPVIVPSINDPSPALISA